MGVISIYLIIALTTAISAQYELFLPILKELEILNPDDLLVQSKKTALVTFFLASLALAPVFMVIILVPGLSKWFHEKMLDTLTAQEI